MKVILVSAKAQHGKDTVANIMKDQLEGMNKKVLICHYADLLKFICSKFFNWDGNKDLKGRQLLQYVGTDTIRNKCKRPNYWVDFIVDILNMFSDEWDYVIIPDARFNNEINVIKDSGFSTSVVRVNRTNFEGILTDSQKKHQSECELDDYAFDYIIENNRSLKELENKVLKCLRCIVTLHSAKD